MTPTIVGMSDRHQTKPYPLRLPDELRERLEAEAKTAGRSLNAEITQRLEASFDKAESYTRNEAEDIVKIAVNYAVDSFNDRLVEAGLLPKTDKGARSLLEELGTAKPKKAKEK